MTIEKRKPNKSKAELDMDAAMDAYAEHFGEEYVIDFAADSMTMEETTAHIRKLIADDEKQKTPEYIKNVQY